MKSKAASKRKSLFIGLALLAMSGASLAGPFPGALSIQLYPGFPHANSVDFHYFPSAGVYFSFRTGQYYYPSYGGWRHSHALPPQYRLQPRERYAMEQRWRQIKHHHHHGDAGRDRWGSRWDSRWDYPRYEERRDYRDHAPRRDDWRRDDRHRG